MAKFTQICKAAALALALSASAQASQTFNFTFSDVDNKLDGTSSISGTILIDGDGDGTFAASSITLINAPSSLVGGITSGDFIFEASSIYTNTFTISGGAITAAVFDGDNKVTDPDAMLAFNMHGFAGYFLNSSYEISDSIGGVESLTFSAAAAPVPEPATWALFMAGAGLMGAGARRRRAVAKTA
jgi:hypothetical protein